MRWEAAFLLLLFPSVCEGTNSPSVSPTTANIALHLYSSPTSFPNGNLGNRTATNLICANVAASIGLGCISLSHRSFLSYPGDSISGLASGLGITPTTKVTTPVYSAGAGYSTWGLLLSNSAAPILKSFNDAGVTPSSAGIIWTGATQTGGTGTDTCNGWTTFALNGLFGITTSTTPNYIVAGTASCGSMGGYLACMCLQGKTPSPTTISPSTSSPTTSRPTVSPTLTPTTLSPTTLTPTKAPTTFAPSAQSLILFPYSPTPQPGVFGGQSGANSLCGSSASSLHLTCRASPAFISDDLGHSISSFPSLYNFPSTLQIQSLGGVPIGRFVDTLAGTGNVLTKSLSSAGITSADIWTGATPTGGASSGLTCGSWAASSSSAIGGSATSIGTTWISSTSGYLCSTTRQLLCLCVMGPAPTPSPIIIPTTSTPTLKPSTASPITSSPTTVSPTTISPTSRSPTTGSPTKHPTSSRPTSYTPTIYLKFAPTTYPGSIAVDENLTSLCSNTFLTSAFPCRVTSAMLSLPSPLKEVSNFPVLYRFPDITNVYSDNGYLGRWIDIFEGGLKIPIGANQMFWTSSYSYGGFLSPSCAGSTSHDFTLTGIVGSASSTASNWFSSTTVACNSPMSLLCMCLLGGTSAPTDNPTTRSPTNFPTPFPTPPPTMIQELRYMYKLPKSSIVQVTNNYNNITFRHLYSSPTNITILSTQGSFQAIGWKNLIFRVYSSVTNQTTTENLGDTVCNPGQPSPIPGTLTVQQDGGYSCPTIEKCILTSNCTDSLAPRNGYSSFPDLRACWCSYTEVIYGLSTSIPSNTEVTLSLFEGKMTPVTQIVPPANVFGNGQCNNWIFRTLNCMFQKSDPFYQPQCVDEPIGCFDMTLGRFFGGFDTQNPLYQYPVDVQSWMEPQYRGIASVMNNLTYSLNGKFADPFTSELWSNYIWIPSNSTLNVFTANLNLVFSSYQAYVIQTDPYIYIANSKPPPSLNNEYSTLPTSQNVACYNSPATACSNLTWNNFNLSSSFHLSGLEFSSPIDPDRTPLTVTLNITSPAPYIKGLEVYNQWGELCGSVFLDGFNTVSQYFVFLCLNAPTANVIHPNSTIVVRILGQESIYDLPQANLNSKFMATAQDPLFSNLNQLLFQPYSNTTYPLMFASLYDANVLTNPRNWPQRQRLTTSLLSSPLPFSGTYNYTTSSSDSASSATLYAKISSSILVSNIYPENLPLRGVQGNYITAPINFTDPTTLAYLRAVWAVWLAPRYVGADESQCLTFQFGESVVTSEVKQRWYAGDVGADYAMEGKEGGCLCDNKFQTGFYYPQLFCQTCLPGYGPATLDALGDTIQFNSLISPLYNASSTLFPSTNILYPEFKQNWSCRFPYGDDPVVSAFDTNNLCASHGIMSYSSAQKNISLLIWGGIFKNSTIACSMLSMQGSLFTLSSEVGSPFNLLYVNESGFIFSIIGDFFGAEIYLTEPTSQDPAECVFTSCSSGDTPADTTFPPLINGIPWTCQISCSTSPELLTSVTCVNPDLFLPVDLSLSLQFTQNIFILLYS